MNRLQVIRVAALLVIIFAAGVLTGRFTAPQPQAVYPGGPAGRWMIIDTAVSRMATDVGLTPDEKQKVRKVFEEMEPQMVRHPPLSEERLKIFRDYIPQIKAQLPPEKQAAVDRYFHDVERRFEIARRRRAKNN